MKKIFFILILFTTVLISNDNKIPKIALENLKVGLKSDNAGLVLSSLSIVDKYNIDGVNYELFELLQSQNDAVRDSTKKIIVKMLTK